MDKLYTFIPKKTLVLITVLVVIIITLAIILFTSQPRKTTAPPAPIISQSPSASFPIQKTIIKKTTINEIEKAYQVRDKQILPNGGLAYSFNSKIEARPDQIIFHDNLAQFERIIVVGNTGVSGQIKLSSQILKYGPAEKVITGSRFYGRHMETHIYATKGFAFIVNPNADEVYEIQTFAPIPLEKYLSNYGDDINESDNKEIKEGI